MTIDPNLLQELESAITTVIGPGVGSFSSASDLFEVYVFGIILDAARAEGATIEFRDVAGNLPQRLIFRSSPGHIYSTVQLYTHAIIRFSTKNPLEVHIGVRVAGKSGVLHECDVAVIDQDEADTCRYQQVPPRSYRLLIAVECKFYSTLLQLNLGRAFIGLTTDISAKKTFFVTNTSSDSVERLLTRRKRDWERNVTPAGNIEVTRLRNAIQQCFRDYRVS